MSHKASFEVTVSIPDCVGTREEGSLEELLSEVHDVTGRLIERAVEDELKAFIGASWHERNAATRRTTRAGYRKRRFTVLGRDVMLRIPRARVAGFRSRFLPFRQRRHAEFDRWAVEAYLSGASMRETTAQLYRMFGTSVSPTTVSTLVKALDEERRSFQSRRLSDDYAFLVLDGMYIRSVPLPAPCLRGVRRGSAARKLVVLLVRGIKPDGTRELVDFRLAVGERERAWEDFLRDLFDRGLEGEPVQCFVHDAETPEEARDRLGAFSRRWTRREPEAVATFRRDFDATLTYLTIPLEYRRWIRTSNPLERTIRELRRRLRPMGTFQGIDSCRRLVYVAVKKLSPERRNSVPYSLWTSQPWYAAKRRPKPPTKAPAVRSLWKEVFTHFRRGISRIAHFA